MPIIYLRHETHGTKVAISEEEAKADQKNGWKRYDPDLKAEESVNEIAKRGRPKKVE